jgi:N-acetylglucosamine kinase-like BadF-type ATPase
VIRYLGVDGGGTKTAFVLLDGDGRTLAETTGPGSYYLADGMAAVQRVLADGVARVTADAGTDAAGIAQAFFALPGYGESSGQEAALDRLPAEVLGHDRYTCGNDMVAGWAGSLGGRDGINVVAGTGSIAYGEREGVGARAGGWSEVFGDEGSGYWVAVRALGAFSRMSDGRLPRGPLHALLRERLQVTDDLDVIGLVVEQWAGKRERIAALSRVVPEAAEAGDEVAAGILADAGRELAALVGAVHAALGAPAGERTAVSYSGGMFTVPAVLDAFTAAVGEGFDLREPVLGPTVGAALVAMRRAGAPLPSVPQPHGS